MNSKMAIPAKQKKLLKTYGGEDEAGNGNPQVVYVGYSSSDR